MKKALLLSVSAIAFGTLPVAAGAQTTEPQTTENQSTAPAGPDAPATAGRASDEPVAGEVIVTATRRNARLQDVPLAVTAYSQRELSQKGIVGYEGLALETPGIVLNKPTANFNNFTARGIATNGYGANLQGAVAIYIDELPISSNGNSTILDPTLYDVERVEFLRGPQGTLFGSGSLSGAMRFLTKSPDLTKFDYSGLMDIGIASGDSLRQRYNGMINIPLVDEKLGLRVVGSYRNEEGWTNNIGTGIRNSNTLEAYGGRAILLWKPVDRLSLRFMYMHENSNPKDSSLISPALGRDTRVSDRPDQFQGILNAYNATLEYEFDFAKLTSSSTYADYEGKFFVDLAGTFASYGPPGPFFRGSTALYGGTTGIYGGPIPFRLDATGFDESFVQETRLASTGSGPFEWTVGGFYFWKRRDVDYIYRSSANYLTALRVNAATGFDGDAYNKFRAYIVSKELAGFGELTYRFSDKFWLTGGLRYGSTEAQAFTAPGGYNSNYLTAAITRQLGFPSPTVVKVDIPAATGLKAEQSKLSWKASASFKPSPNMTMYATVATGFRTPIVNARAGAASLLDPTDIIIPAGASSDKLTNYEVGLKGRWLDGKLTANIAAYYIDWSNIQVQANRVSDQVQFATNIGGAYSRGVEFEVGIFPIPGLSIAANGSFNRAKVDRLTAQEAGFSGAVDGARLASPKFQGSLSTRYNFDLNDTSRAFVAASIAHVGSFPGLFPRVPGRPTVIQPTYAFTQAYETVNLSAGVTRGAVTATLYVENLLDNRQLTYVHPEAFITSRFAAQRPRTIGVRLGYNM